MNNELKPCPFCGREVKKVAGFKELYFYKCTNKKDCGAIMSFDCDLYNRDPKKSIEAYNRREDYE